MNIKTPPLIEQCIELYRKSTNSQPVFHEIATNKIYFFHLGQEPLDYIYIFQNEEDQSREMPRHWHYVGFGLTDIYGFCFMSKNHPDPKVKDLSELYPPSNHGQSGFGYELTFRLKCDSDECWSLGPPKWPCQLLQKIARQNFCSRNILSSRDILLWNPDESLSDSDSNIQNFLLTIDPQLQTQETSRGGVQFIQLVGVFCDELEAAKASSVQEILDILQADIHHGGRYLVTDMRRGLSIFQSNSINHKRVEERIRESGSKMKAICTTHDYSSSEPKWFKQASSRDKVTHFSKLIEQNPYGIERGTFSSSTFQEYGDSSHCVQQDNPSRNPSRMSCESDTGLLIENYPETEERFYDSLYLLLNYEAASMLPIVLIGRLKHKLDFSYLSPDGKLMTSLVPEGSQIKSLVSRDRPLVRRGALLQVFISNELLEDMYSTLRGDFEHDSSLCIPSEKRKDLQLPKNYSWEKFGLHLTVVD